MVRECSDPELNSLDARFLKQPFLKEVLKVLIQSHELFTRSSSVQQWTDFRIGVCIKNCVPLLAHLFLSLVICCT